MTEDRTSIGFAIQYKHISGKMRLSIIASSPILAKANYLKAYFVDVDSTWTSNRVEEAWTSWQKLHDAQVVEVYVRPC